MELIDIPQTRVLHDGRLFGLAEYILRVVLHPELGFNLARKSWSVGAGHEHGPRVSKEKVAPLYLGNISFNVVPTPIKCQGRVGNSNDRIQFIPVNYSASSES